MAEVAKKHRWWPRTTAPVPGRGKVGGESAALEHEAHRPSCLGCANRKCEWGHRVERRAGAARGQEHPKKHLTYSTVYSTIAVEGARG